VWGWHSFARIAFQSVKLALIRLSVVFVFVSLHDDQPLADRLALTHEDPIKADDISANDILLPSLPPLSTTPFYVVTSLMRLNLGAKIALSP
jgi:hypothetical protein